MRRITADGQRRGLNHVSIAPAPPRRCSAGLAGRLELARSLALHGVVGLGVAPGMSRGKSRPEEPPRLPIKLDPVSNGEFAPPPLSPRIAAVQRLAHDRAACTARRLGVSRRDFLRSTAGAATVLLALDQLAGCGGRSRVPPEVTPAGSRAGASGPAIPPRPAGRTPSSARAWRAASVLAATSTARLALARRDGGPGAAGHVLGTLLLHLGEDRILWGTDCLWYGFAAG